MGCDFTREAAIGGPVAGVDEVGRGPLAGPVTAAAVVFVRGVPEGLADSKALKPDDRVRLAHRIRDCAVWAVAWADVGEIDALNIRGASLLAMARAVAALGLCPSTALIDGNAVPQGLPCRAEAIVKGDALCASIAAASILAKVARDSHMVALAQQHPGYGWETNMGYPTAAHRQALLDVGITPHHRRSFAPVREILWQAETANA